MRVIDGNALIRGFALQPTIEPERNGDTISRQAAIDALWKALYEYEDNTERQFRESENLDVGNWIGHRIFVQNMSDIDRQTILNLPSAQPERLKGHWIIDGHHVQCSVCAEMMCNTDREGDKIPMSFCPNCGSDMRGGQDE